VRAKGSCSTRNYLTDKPNFIIHKSEVKFSSMTCRVQQHDMSSAASLPLHLYPRISATLSRGVSPGLSLKTRRELYEPIARMSIRESIASIKPGVRRHWRAVVRGQCEPLSARCRCDWGGLHGGAMSAVDHLILNDCYRQPAFGNEPPSMTCATSAESTHARAMELMFQLMWTLHIPCREESTQVRHGAQR